MHLEDLVGRARDGDMEAFAEVTRRFQQMAFGYALALLRDLHQAEDVVQEAFVAAWFGLRTLADPAAFPGWLRTIVRHQAHRFLRQRHLDPLPLDVAHAVPAGDGDPDRRLEQAQQPGTVLDAIERLPVSHREVVTVFYVHDCTQQDIATFLGLPVTTVNNRLHAARAQLKRGTLIMVKDTLEAHRLPDDFAARSVYASATKRGWEKKSQSFRAPRFVRSVVLAGGTRRPPSAAAATRRARTRSAIHDDLPDAAMYFAGGMDDILARATAPKGPRPAD